MNETIVVEYITMDGNLSYYRVVCSKSDQFHIGDVLETDSIQSYWRNISRHAVDPTKYIPTRRHRDKQLYERLDVKRNLSE